MKTLSICVVAALAVSGFTAANAANADGAVVNRDYTDIVSPANQQAYEAGVKAFNQCLREHGSKYAWTAWAHQTGNVYSYSFVTGPHTWADFDAMREVGKACDATWRTQANPHLESEYSAFMIDQPEMSYMPADWASQPQPRLIAVVLFTLKPGREADATFKDVVKKIAAAADKAKWPYHFRSLATQGGDEGAPDYIAVFPSKSWAEYGAWANASLWKMVEGVYGKAEADAMRKSINDVIAKSSDHIDSYDADLSYIPGK